MWVSAIGWCLPSDTKGLGRTRYHGDRKTEAQQVVSLFAFMHWLETRDLLIQTEVEEKLGCKPQFVFYLLFIMHPLHLALYIANPQSAANVVQAGTKELTTKVRDGDYNVNERVNVVTVKTTEIGHRTWGMVRGVMALATQKVEEYAKEVGTPRKTDDWPRNKNQGDRFSQELKSWNSNGGNGGVSVNSSSGRNAGSSAWDDWDNDGYRKHASDNGDSWAG
ncbi:probable ADP-ribosylation factor GTPase-activating protein AGD6 [Helianthus annuus]|uniref:probable ADP-ribosylation factor GTPase-activating protein AGD6 n=1 Tax=Helianthus annuus TaxID=4232 RepID=UPI001652BD4B|nr:probable ADP-ribosylation factor GTPase-activating protein AGD6 [Helianthus annuus]